MGDLLSRQGGRGLAIYDQRMQPTVPVTGVERPQRMAWNPDGSFAYVITNTEIWRIDGSNWIADAPAVIPLQSWQVLFNLDGSKAYVVPYALDAVYVVDTATNTITGTVTGLPAGTYQQIALTPDGSELWVFNSISFGVSAIERVNTTTDARTTSFSTSAYNTTRMVFNPSGTKFYIAAYNGTVRLAIVDAATHTEITTFSPADAGYGSLCPLPDGSEIWALYSDATYDTATYVARISCTTDAIVGSLIVLPAYAGPMAVLPDGTKAYVATENGHVKVIDVSTHAITTDITISPLADYALDMVMDPYPSYNYLYITEPGRSVIRVVDTYADVLAYTIDDESTGGPQAQSRGTFSELVFLGADVVDLGDGRARVVISPVSEWQLPGVSETAGATENNFWASSTRVVMQTSTTFTGFFSPGIDGWTFCLVNVSGGNCVIKHDDSGSDYGNRAYLVGSADLTIPHLGSAFVCYSQHLNGWTVIAANV